VARWFNTGEKHAAKKIGVDPHRAFDRDSNYRPPCCFTPAHDKNSRRIEGSVAAQPVHRQTFANRTRLTKLSQHGTLPPAYTVDAEGNRLHSWRTLILPYFEQKLVFESIDFSKPWDDPANTEARETVMSIYECPSALHEEGLTTYLGVFGPNCVFSGSVPRKMSEITDAMENTIAVVDVDSDQAVHWMSPYDVSEEVVLKYDSKSQTNHPGMLLAAFLDGHVEAISLDIDQDILRGMLTVAGGETIAD